MSSSKRYWQDLAQLDRAADVIKGRENEFQAPLPIDEMLADKGLTGSTTGRRDFLKFLGFGVGAAALAACETPVIKSIPYVNKPEEIVPGVATWYASTYYDGSDYASILVKTREGRPIHIMGNPRFGINRNPKLSVGAVSARINSSVLGLYDSERLKGPVKYVVGENGTAGQASTWSEADKAIMAKLDAVATGDKRIVLLTGTVISPSTKAAIAKLQGKYASAPAAEGSVATSKVDHVQYDAISYSGLTNANEKSFGLRVMPSYDLTKADVIVAVDCDFLSTWGSTTEHSWQYTSRRRPEDGGMNKHWQFEARMSNTGANADMRVAVKVSELPAVVIGLHDAIAKKAGGATVGGGSENASVARAADELWAAKGKSLVLAGSNDEGVQTLVNSINTMLGNYGSTIDLANPTYFYQGDDAAMDKLVADMNAGRIGALLIADVNPAYQLSNAAEFRTGLGKVDLSVHMGTHADETASLCHWNCADHHFLESWNDLMPKTGRYALAQPTIRPLFDTRQWQESLLRWAGDMGSYHELIRSTWRTAMSSRTDAATMPPFERVWETSLHDGGFDAYTGTPSAVVFTGDVKVAGDLAKKSASVAGEWELALYTKESIGDGRHANNPWLQELPDPLSKVTWDNYVLMAPVDMKRLGLNIYLGQEHPASLVKVAANGGEIELPVVPAPGQKAGTISIALGYGRGANGERVGRAACLLGEDGLVVPVGRNAYPFTSRVNGTVSYAALSATVSPTGATYPMALTQTHMTDMDRHSAVKETSLGVWAKHDPKGTYNHPHTMAVHEDVNEDGAIDARDRKPVKDFDLWEEHPLGVNHRWGMSIDLNSCTGCGACITACTSENNVSVVGKDEVRRSREMHWLRLDRYYSSEMTKERAQEEGVGKIDMYLRMEVPEENPKVVFMPMMCQHCNHAPCETVCPVAATTHSNEGLNMMAYNRCIGTRYCSNNCPYKVRRFNWFNYVTDKFAEVNPAWDDLGRMVLNPDVVVRSRGVIEKCSLCVQRIQAGKLDAKKASTPVADGAIQTACMAACGSGAIVFGDLNDSKSRVRQLHGEERAYYALEEIGVKPNVSYLAKVRNSEETEAHHA
ncbi:MAG: TAT-variant-translocated molybdopterin oxidoreductase [Flavobacteriales bacterium]|nr:TAT-variant-translocated molybdopterin oxidoreductase [Flavobacteriales bacterium]